MTRDEILHASNAEIIKHAQNIQYLYRMHGIIRYDQERNEGLRSESVSEHTHAMAMLAHYFLPLEESEYSLDRQKIYELIVWHDIAEIETGDKVTYRKTSADEQTELDALETVYRQIPGHMQEKITSLVDEYEECKSIEAQFVKAIDQIEPWFSNMDPDGRARIIDVCQTSQDDLIFAIDKKKKYARKFDTIYKFADEIGEFLVKEQYHTT